MSTAQFQNFQPYAASGVAPQGIDIGSIVGTVAQHAVQILPGLLMGLLSSHPQLQQLQQSRQGVAPQSFSLSTPFGGFSVSDSKPQLGAAAGGSGVAPQGIDIGSIVSTVAQHAVQILPGLLMTLLSAHPQLSQLSQQSRQGVAPQGFTLSTPLGGFSVSDSRPQLGANGAGVAPQGIDFGSILNTVVSGAAEVLPTLLTSLLSAHPQVQQLSAQGIDFGAIARTVAGVVVPQIPTIANGLLNHFLGSQGSVR